MSTSFFTDMSKYLAGSDVTLTMTAKDDKLTVSIKADPKADDPALKKLPPLVLTGTPEELDQEFFVKIESPMDALSGITDNVIQFEAALKAAEAETKAAKEAEEQKKKDAKKAKELVPKIKEAVEAENWEEARKQLDKAKELDPDVKGIVTLEKKINKALPAPAEEDDLFNDGDNATTPEQPEAETPAPKEQSAETPEPATEESPEPEKETVAQPTEPETLPATVESKEPKEEATMPEPQILGAESAEEEAKVKEALQEAGLAPQPQSESQPEEEEEDLFADPTPTEPEPAKPNVSDNPTVAQSAEANQTASTAEQPPQEEQPHAEEESAPEASAEEATTFTDGQPAPEGKIFRCSNCHSTSVNYYDSCAICLEPDGYKLADQ